MTQIIKNELIKMYYHKRILGCFIFFIIILTLSIVFFNSQKGESGIAESKRYINALKIKAASSKSIDEKNEIQKNINSIESNIQQYFQIKNTSTRWKINLIKTTNELQNQNTNNLNNIEKEKLNGTIAQNKYLIKNNIKPLNAFLKSQTAFFAQFINMLNMMLFIIVIFMVSNSVSEEYSSKTIKFLLTRPISKAQLILGKFFTGVLSITAIITIFDIIVYIVSGIAFGFDSLKFPIIVGAKFVSSPILDNTLNKFISLVPNTSTIIPFYDLLFKIWILQVFFIIASTSFCIFISSLSKNNIMPIVIPIIIYIANIYIFFQSSVFYKITPILSGFFINLYDSSNIATRAFVQNTGAAYINTSSSIAIMILWSILFIILSMLSTLKKYA
ncbi:hypothetical protein EXN57_14030 [Clostridium botulinum]|nr:hypothetical protein [Clostridium botulinum]NFD33985.1 hypothetical protein [Clostridium botulinum]NFD59091.1 hypothetical protein [Clostridium botulinum]NFE02384.1 hypothetical protein [Clostridium botulinum]